MKLLIINSFIAAILSFGAFLFFAGDGAMSIIKQLTSKTATAPTIVSAAPLASTNTSSKSGSTASVATSTSVATAAALPTKTDYSIEKSQILDNIKALAPQLKIKKDEYIKLQNANKDMNRVKSVNLEWICQTCGKPNPGVGSAPPSKCFYCSSKKLEPAPLETQASREAKVQAVKSAHEELKIIEKQMAELQAQFSEISKKEQEAKAALKQMQAANPVQ